MKIRVLIKQNFDKIYNILPLLEKNVYVARNDKNVVYYDDSNWLKIFKETVRDYHHKKIDSIIVFDDYGFLPFLFFSKHKYYAACNPSVREVATLARSHNNSNTCVIGLKEVHISEVNEILNSFLSNKFEAGRHLTRVNLMHKCFRKTLTHVRFNKKTKNILIASDHAGYDLKLDVIKHLKAKGYSVIDVGTHSHNTCHYPLYGFELVRHARRGCCGIAICGTGLGISNTVNKFAGVKSVVCVNTKQAKLARSEFGINVLSLGARFIDTKKALDIVDTYLNTQQKTDAQYKVFDRMGYAFMPIYFKRLLHNL